MIGTSRFAARRALAWVALVLFVLAWGARGAAAQIAPDMATGEVRGVVRATPDAASTPLPYAMVELVAGAVRRTVLADGEGRYVLRAVPAGMGRVRALHIGHALGEVEVLVPAGSTVQVDLQLARQPVRLPELSVLAGVTLPDLEPLTLRPATPAWAAGEIALRSLAEGTGMAEAGMVRAAGGSDGGSDPSDPRDVLLMRGSTTDLKLVLLDGAPVYTPFHLGGLLPSFDVTTMGGASLHVGGAPARYDGGLSYILDLRTRSPRRDRLRGGAALDLMSAQASLEGPLGPRAGALVAGRALHDVGAALWSGSRSPYGYVDGLLRLAAEPAAGHRLGLTAFANRESVFLDLGSTHGLVGPDAASWGNGALTLGYHGGGVTQIDVAAAATRYEAELPIAPDSAVARLAPTVARGRTDRLRATVDAARPLGRGTLRFGGAADRMDVRYGARALAGSSTPSLDATASGVVTGFYADLSTPASPTVGLRMGLRADHFSSDGRLRWAPRFAVHWSLSGDALLTLAAGRYHQYTRGTDAEVEGAVADLAQGERPATAVAGRSLLPVATADHLVLSLDQQLSPTTRLGLQGFVKGFTGLDGSARPLTSSGLDLRVAREGEDLTGWLGYSLAWSWSPDGTNGSTTSQFSGRHLLSAGLTGRLAGPFGMDLKVAFSDGLPYTSIPLSASEAPGREDAFVPTVTPGGGLDSGNPALAGGPADGFLRIDAEVHAELRPGLRPYFKVLNALARRDALFWYFAPWRDPKVQPLAELTLVPVLGVEWRF